jgi:hypothetical protein
LFSLHSMVIPTSIKYMNNNTTWLRVVVEQIKKDVGENFGIYFYHRV